MIKIREDFKKRIFPLTPEEFAQLEENILKEGIREPILTWQNVIVDGHNRYEIAQKHNLKFLTAEVQFDDDNECQQWMIKNQFGRRNLQKYQRSVLALALEDLYKDKAKKSKAEKVSHYRQTGEVLPTLAKPNTRKEISDIANVSHGTLDKVKVIEAKAAPEIKQKLSTGEVSINQVYQEIKKEEKKEQIKNKVKQERVDIKIFENIKNGDCLSILSELSDGCIDIILTDPPYGINYKSNRSIYDQTITKRGLINDGEEAFELLDNVCKVLEKKTAKNAHLYFFCSWSVFSRFEEIIGKYFDIKTPLVWDKGNKGSGDLENDWGNQTEIIIFCTKGKKLINKRKGNLLSVSRLHTSKMVHPTQKPDELIRQILEVSYVGGDFIVDPFMGSGSTLKVCKEINAKCLGIEIDNEMFKIANEYINS